MSRIRGVIFDLDGVLCSTDELHYRAWKQLADELAIPFDRTVNRRLRGVSREESLEILLEASKKTYSDEEKRTFAGRKNDAYRALLNTLSEKDVSEGVLRTLAVLRERGVRIAVGSSSKNTPLILRRIGLDKAFDAVADGNDVVRSKPDPAVFLKAAERLGLPPRECLVVEDAESGVRAGIAGGFHTAAIGDAVSCRKAEYSLCELSDLLALPLWD